MRFDKTDYQVSTSYASRVAAGMAIITIILLGSVYVKYSVDKSLKFSGSAYTTASGVRFDLGDDHFNRSMKSVHEDIHTSRKYAMYSGLSLGLIIGAFICLIFVCSVHYMAYRNKRDDDMRKEGMEIAASEQHSVL